MRVGCGSGEFGLVGLEYGWVYLDEHARVLHGGLLLHLAHDLHLAVVGHCE